MVVRYLTNRFIGEYCSGTGRSITIHPLDISQWSVAVGRRRSLLMRFSVLSLGNRVQFDQWKERREHVLLVRLQYVLPGDDQGNKEQREKTRRWGRWGRGDVETLKKLRKHREERDALPGRQVSRKILRTIDDWYIYIRTVRVLQLSPTHLSNLPLFAWRDRQSEGQMDGHVERNVSPPIDADKTCISTTTT